MSGRPEGSEGLFGSLKNVAATLLAMGQARLELLGNEIEVQKLTALRLLLLAQGLMFCAGVGTVLLVALLALLAWEQRVVLVAVLAGGFALAAFFFYRALMRLVNSPEPAFAATLAELREDVRKLKASTGHASTAD